MYVVIYLIVWQTHSKQHAHTSEKMRIPYMAPRILYILKNLAKRLEVLEHADYTTLSL